VRFYFPSTIVQSKNIGLHIFYGILWEVLQKVTKFFDAQKMPFWTINYFNLRWDILRNYLGCSKISSKSGLTSFMLIRLFNKLQDIPIAINIKIDKIIQLLKNFKISMKLAEISGAYKIGMKPNWDISLLPHTY